MLHFFGPQATSQPVPLHVDPAGQSLPVDPHVAWQEPLLQSSPEPHGAPVRPQFGLHSPLTQVFPDVHGAPVPQLSLQMLAATLWHV